MEATHWAECERLMRELRQYFEKNIVANHVQMDAKLLTDAKTLQTNREALADIQSRLIAELARVTQLIGEVDLKLNDLSTRRFCIAELFEKDHKKFAELCGVVVESSSTRLLNDDEVKSCLMNHGAQYVDRGRFFEIDFAQLLTFVPPAFRQDYGILGKFFRDVDVSLKVVDDMNVQISLHQCRFCYEACVEPLCQFCHNSVYHEIDFLNPQFGLKTTIVVML